MTRHVHPTFTADTAPKSAAAFVRAILPAVLEHVQPATFEELWNALSTDITVHYGRVSHVAAVLGNVVPKTLSNVLAPLNRNGERVPHVSAVKKGGKTYYSNLDFGAVTEAAEATAAVTAPADAPFVPPVTVNEARAANGLPPVGEDMPGLCQSKHGLWADPPARCVWGDAAGFPVPRRLEMIRALLEMTPPPGDVRSASRIRRMASQKNLDVCKLTRSNVGAILIHLMRDGQTNIICRHNAKRKRRVLYMWHRS